ncbi:hypothetical protein [Gordonia sihwensis]|uniref:hypothetical protein n=1 Tax=Gordonia sihwensis TaxID=173559 RepID=UPI003D96466B
MSFWSAPTDRQLMECFAAYHVAEHARLRWRVECINTLIGAVNQLPPAADTTPLLNAAWAALELDDVQPSGPLRPADALEVLRPVAASFMVDLDRYVPGFYDPAEASLLRGMSEYAVLEKIRGYHRSLEILESKSAELARRITHVLRSYPKSPLSRL